MGIYQYEGDIIVEFPTRPNFGTFDNYLIHYSKETMLKIELDNTLRR